MEEFLYVCKVFGWSCIVFFFIGPIFADVYVCISIEKCDFGAVKYIFGTMNVAWFLLLGGVLILCINYILGKFRTKIK